MTITEYLYDVVKSSVEMRKVKKIERIYGKINNVLVKKILSHADKTTFLDDNWRVLAYDEIQQADDDLHVNFRDRKLLPLIDSGDNNFIVYHLAEDIWSKFNIVDETIFRGTHKIEQLFLCHSSR